MNLDEVTTEELVEELGLRGALENYSIFDLVCELENRTEVTSIESSNRWTEFVIAIQNGEIRTFAGKATILVVEE
jgi:hypothetical protein